VPIHRIIFDFFIPNVRLYCTMFGRGAEITLLKGC